jgi:hypothetical protein
MVLFRGGGGHWGRGEGSGHEVDRGSTPLSGPDVSCQKVNLGVKARGGGGGVKSVRREKRGH